MDSPLVGPSRFVHVLYDSNNTVDSSHVLSKQGARNCHEIDAKPAGTGVFAHVGRASKRFSVNLLDGKAEVWQTLAHAVETSTGFECSLFLAKVLFALNCESPKE